MVYGMVGWRLLIEELDSIYPGALPSNQPEILSKIKSVWASLTICLVSAQFRYIFLGTEQDATSEDKYKDTFFTMQMYRKAEDKNMVL